MNPPSKWYCNDDRDAITARRQSALFPKYGVENTPYLPTCPVALSGSWVLMGFNRGLHIDVSGGLGLSITICDEADNGADNYQAKALTITGQGLKPLPAELIGTLRQS